MQLWFEACGAAAVAAIGAVLGAAISRLPRAWWTTGAVLPPAAIAVIALGRRFAQAALMPPMSWMMQGRTEFAVLGAAIAMLVATLWRRLPSKRLGAMFCAFAVLAIADLSILPFALPAVTQASLMQLETQVDPDGVCLQNAYYTCGPASAVTALHALGLEGKEGELAVLSRTTRLAGTEPDLLCEALRERYRDRGLSCEYRVLHNIDELAAGAVMLALVKHSLFVDHYVAVLAVTGGQVVTGDPLYGRRVIPVAEFEKMWRFTGIVVKRIR
jgi:hypothetical protein